MDSEGDKADERTRALVDKALAGDREAMATLYSMYEKRMISAVHARLGHTLHSLMESVDLVQSVWKDVLNELPAFEYRGPDSFGRWLQTCLINKVHGKRRYHKAGKRDAGKAARLENQDILPAEAGRNVPDPTPSQAVIRREELQKLMEILEDFPEEQRWILILRMRDELSFEEIGERVGKSTEAVKKTYQRSLNRLIDRLPEEWR